MLHSTLFPGDMLAVGRSLGRKSESSIIPYEAAHILLFILTQVCLNRQSQSARHMDPVWAACLSSRAARLFMLPVKTNSWAMLHSLPLSSQSIKWFVSQTIHTFWTWLLLIFFFHRKKNVLQEKNIYYVYVTLIKKLSKTTNRIKGIVFLRHVIK